MFRRADDCYVLDTVTLLCSFLGGDVDLVVVYFDDDYGALSYLEDLAAFDSTTVFEAFSWEACEALGGDAPCLALD